MGRAVALGQWVGTSARQVTAGQVLRKAEVPAAGAALGVLVPPRLRTMADVRALHRPWRVAVATGLARRLLLLLPPLRSRYPTGRARLAEYRHAPFT